MSKYKILYVASEINPFLQTTEVAEFVRQLPQAMQERGMEIRILVPRFGLINERKNLFWAGVLKNRCCTFQKFSAGLKRTLRNTLVL